MLGIRLWNTCKQAKDMFVMPKMKFWFGRWRDFCGLPVWRYGPAVTLVKRKNITNGPMSRGTIGYDIEKRLGYVCKAYHANLSVLIKGKDNIYRTSYHKIKGIHDGDLVWNGDIRKKLKKYHLTWLKPQYILPTFLAFHVTNLDVMWKWKYDDIRYEFPPQFNVVFFGLCFSIVLVAPSYIVNNKEEDYPDFYWEALLNYLYNDNEKTMQSVINNGSIITGGYNTEKMYRYLSVRPEFIRRERLEEYYECAAKFEDKLQ